MEVPEIVTPRLRLVSLSAAFIWDLLDVETIDGIADARPETWPPAPLKDAALNIPAWWPDEGDVKWLRYRLRQMLEDETTTEWLIRAMIVRASAEMIGHINFHGPPEHGFAELGYTVFPEHRRAGYAVEAAEAMISWAGRTHGVRRFRLSISPSNQPSLAMAAKMGFVKVGEQIDEEDGLEFVFERVS